ncbi:hypothetical protein ACFWBF_17900 [Streptomyces sp. NPDC060028]|uniref:hypothetical protein n=1 Tax=Streptomyces sp. NPDC060028 TaxID=3347041 RepID=UPI0036C4D57A
MSPEKRTPLRLGPLPLRAGWLAGSAVASLAALMISFTSPALAAAEPPTAAGSAPAASPLNPDKCRGGKEHHDYDSDDEYDPGEEYASDDEDEELGVRGGVNRRDRDKCRGARGPAGPPGPPGPPGAAGPCVDISTSWDEAEVKYKAVLAPNGTAWAGVYDFNAPNPMVPAFTWYDLTTGATNYPASPCGITIAETSNRVIVEVVTTGGQVFETTCPVTRGEPDRLACPNPVVWTPANPQPPGTTPTLTRDKGLSKGGRVHSPTR